MHDTTIPAEEVIHEIFVRGDFDNKLEIPKSILQDMVKHIQPRAAEKILVLHNVELAVELVRSGIIPEDITLYGMQDYWKPFIAQKLGFNYQRKIVSRPPQKFDIIVGYTPYAYSADASSFLTELNSLTHFLKPGTRWLFGGPTKCAMPYDGNKYKEYSERDQKVVTDDGYKIIPYYMCREWFVEYGWNFFQNDIVASYAIKAVKSKPHSLFGGVVGNTDKKIHLKNSMHDGEYDYNFVPTWGDRNVTGIVNKFFGYHTCYPHTKEKPPGKYIAVSRIAGRYDPWNTSTKKRPKCIAVFKNETPKKFDGQYIPCVDDADADRHHQSLVGWNVSRFAWREVFFITGYLPTFLRSRIPDLSQYTNNEDVYDALGLTPEEKHAVRVWHNQPNRDKDNY